MHTRVDLLELLALTKVQTPMSAARQLFGVEKPTRAEVERARRRLEHLVAGGEGGEACGPVRWCGRRHGGAVRAGGGAGHGGYLMLTNLREWLAEMVRALLVALDPGED